MSICLALGYPDDTKEPTISPSRQTYVTGLLARLDQIDLSMAQAIVDSMAVKVGELSVNFPVHINLLRLEGSRLLRHLSNLTGLPLLYDRYRETDLWVPVTFNKWKVAAIGDQVYFDRFQAQAQGLSELSKGTQSSYSIRSY